MTWLLFSLALLGIVPALLLVFLGLYLAVMFFLRLRNRRPLRWFEAAVFWPLYLAAGLYDWVMQCTLAWALFLDAPRERMVTGRLERYQRAGSGWRYHLACAVCVGLLDGADPSGCHCKP